MQYSASRILPYTPRRIWSVLENVEHFARNDPFHHDFEYITPRRSGVGTAFRITHTYFPVFPFAADHVVCRIIQWEPERIQTLLESNERLYRNHIQRFLLTQKGSATIVQYTINYRGLPSWLFPFSQWVRWGVRRRMEAKLSELAVQCDRGEAKADARESLAAPTGDAITHPPATLMPSRR